MADTIISLSKCIDISLDCQKKLSKKVTIEVKNPVPVNSYIPRQDIISKIESTVYKDVLDMLRIGKSKEYIASYLKNVLSKSPADIRTIIVNMSRKAMSDYTEVYQYTVYTLKERPQDFFWSQHWRPAGMDKSVTNYGCVAAAFMMAKSMIDPTFALTKENYKKTISDLEIKSNSGSSILNIAKLLSDIESWNARYDGIVGNNDRENAKNYIRDHLSQGHPIVASLWFTKSDYNGFNYHHAVTIVGLKETQNGGGSIISYLDPYATDPSKALKTMDYTLFLDKMKASGEGGSTFEYFYQAVSL